MITVRVENRLRELRARYNAKRRELARKVGVTRQTIIAIENSRIQPSLRLALKSVRVSGMKIEGIFFFREEGNDPE